jgi:alanine racemase
MVFGYTPMAFRDKLMAFQLIQSVSTTDYAQRLSDIAVAQGSKAKIHIKIDTGMGRLGFQANEEKSVVNEIASIFRMSGLKIEGIFTHFASADAPDKSDTLKQLENFHDLLNRLSRAGLEFPIRHAANSAALIDVPEAHLDMVRPGIALYGLYPSDDVDKSRIKLVPAMTLKTRVAHIKKVPTGFRVSYGSTFKTNKPTSIATVSIGYADGYNRLLSSKGQMLLHGQRAPLVGRVCMDLTMLDVGHISTVQQDDEVVVFGQQGSGLISADELAAALNTINYEIVTSLTHRVPRLYTH